MIKTRMTRKAVAFALVAFVGAALFAQQPYWWDNPHRDDQFAMYERGMATGAASEQDALKKAILAAKEMLVERVGIGSALEAAGLSSSPEYAIVNFEVANSGTERVGKTWNAWALIKYPQEEKQKILDRWNASIASINALKAEEETIPVQFGLSLATADGSLLYRDGETVSFSVKSEEDCFLILLDHQSDGTTVLLFPNRFQRDSLIRKGQPVQIPSPDDPAFRMTVGAPFGDDRIEAIASTRESELHERFETLVEGLPESQSVAVVSRGVFVEGLKSAMDSSRAGNASGAKSPAAKRSDDSIKWSRAMLNLSTYAK